MKGWNFGVSWGNLDHRLAYSYCWNIDVLTDLADVIPVIA